MLRKLVVGSLRVRSGEIGVSIFLDGLVAFVVGLVAFVFFGFLRRIGEEAGARVPILFRALEVFGFLLMVLGPIVFWIIIPIISWLR